MGYSPRGHKESDTTERLRFTFTSIGLTYNSRLLSIFMFSFSFFWPHGLRDPSTPTKDQTCAPCGGSNRVLTTESPGNSQRGLVFLKEMKVEFYERTSDRD